MRVRQRWLASSAIAALVLALVLASGCSSDGEQESDSAGEGSVASEESADEGTAEDGTVDETGDDDAAAGDEGTLSWVDIELTDVATGETFRVSDFSGEQVLVESFAVW
jgi:hypothetical protein